MMTITTLAQLREVLEDGNYGYYGIRGAHEADIENLERGYLDCSYDWCDNESTEEQLNGTCAIGISEYISDNELSKRYEKALNCYAAFHGTNIVLLIADNNCEYGEDENEVILGSNGYGADVIAIVRF